MYIEKDNIVLINKFIKPMRKSKKQKEPKSNEVLTLTN